MLLSTFNNIDINDKQCDPKTRKRNAELYVIDAAFWCIWNGLVTVPVLNALYTASIQLKMVNELCVFYNVPFSKKRTQAMLSALGVGIANGFASQFALRMLPGFAGVTMALFAAASVFALGQVFIHHFENGGNLEDMDAEAARQIYQDNLAEAKQKVFSFYRRPAA